MARAKDIESLLKGKSSQVRRLTKALIAIARRNTPGAEERVYFGWKNVMYTYGGMKKAVCAVGPLTSYVNLYLMRGPDLKDPAGLIEGKGHVKVRSLQDARRPALAALIRAAAKLANER